MALITQVQLLAVANFLIFWPKSLDGPLRWGRVGLGLGRFLNKKDFRNRPKGWLSFKVVLIRPLLCPRFVWLEWRRTWGHHHVQSKLLKTWEIALWEGYDWLREAVLKDRVGIAMLLPLEEHHALSYSSLDWRESPSQASDFETVYRPKSNQPLLMGKGNLAGQTMMLHITKKWH